MRRRSKRRGLSDEGRVSRDATRGADRRRRVAEGNRADGSMA